MHAATSPDSPAPAAGVPVRMVVVTSTAICSVFKRAAAALSRDMPGLTLTLHAATDWAEDGEALSRCLDDIAAGDIIVASMLFMEDHVRAVLPALEARREHCDAMIGALSAGEIIRLTKLGPFRMDGSGKGPLALLKRLRGAKSRSSGSGQMAVLRRLPKILRFIPGAAAGPSRLFPDDAVLAVWVGREPVGHGPFPDRPLRRRSPAGPSRAARGAGPARLP